MSKQCKISIYDCSKDRDKPSSWICIDGDMGDFEQFMEERLTEWGGWFYDGYDEDDLPLGILVTSKTRVQVDVDGECRYEYSAPNSGYDFLIFELLRHWKVEDSKCTVTVTEINYKGMVYTDIKRIEFLKDVAAYRDEDNASEYHQQLIRFITKKDCCDMQVYFFGVEWCEYGGYSDFSPVLSSGIVEVRENQKYIGTYSYSYREDAGSSRKFSDTLHAFVEKDGEGVIFSVLLGGKLYKKISKNDKNIIYYYTPFGKDKLSFAEFKQGGNPEDIIFTNTDGKYWYSTQNKDFDESRFGTITITPPQMPDLDSKDQALARKLLEDYVRALYDAFNSAEEYKTQVGVFKRVKDSEPVLVAQTDDFELQGKAVSHYVGEILNLEENYAALEDSDKYIAIERAVFRKDGVSVTLIFDDDEKLEILTEDDFGKEYKKTFDELRKMGLFGQDFPKTLWVNKTVSDFAENRETYKKIRDATIGYGIKNFLSARAERLADVNQKIKTIEKAVPKALDRHAIKGDKDIWLEFFKFQIYKRSHLLDIKGAEEARFNLLIKSNDEMQLVKFLKEVGEELEFDKIEDYTEEKLEKIEDLSTIFEENDMLIIHGCEERPSDAVQGGTGTRDEELRRAVERYKLRWERIAEAAKQPNAARLIIIADDIVYRRTFKRNSEIFERLCRHHLEIPDLTADDVYQMCLKWVKDSKLRMSKEAEEELEKWVSKEYPRSELKGESFVEELFNNQIIPKLLSQKQESPIFTLDLIPESETHTQEEVLEELNKLAGLEVVKAEFKKMYAEYSMRDVLGGEDKRAPHMCFVGNPGTGKTTVAKMVADMLYDMKIIKKDYVVEKKAGDLVSKYSSGASQLATKIIREAYGGVLFIDEAYGLARKDSQNTQEVLEALIQEMEDAENPERPVVIFAGYEKEMRELMAANPGLESRIRRWVRFEDYKEDELFEILYKMLREKGFELDVPEEYGKRLRDNREGKAFKLENLPEELSGLSDLIKAKKNKENFGNARDMRMLCDELIEEWAATCVENKRNAQNVSDDYSQEKVITKANIDALRTETKDGITELIGLTVLKEKLGEFEERVKYITALRRNGTYIPDTNMHMLFVGNPGTGKTTVAKRLADKLCQIGVLATNKCIVVESKDLVKYQQKNGEHMGPAQITEDFVRRATGGILFIDEAYELARNSGVEAIEVLLTAMEEHKEDTIFIFAGYPKEMDVFLETNPGLKSRIANRFEFPDYTPEELIEILYLEMKQTGETEEARLCFADDEAAIERLLEIMEMFSAIPDFGNGRFVGNLLKQIIDKRATTRGYKKADSENLRTLTTEDIPTIKELLRTSYGKEGIADPEKMKEDIIKRVAYHEMGHAVVSLATDGDTPIEKISVKGAYGSYGRVRYHLDGESLETEQKLKNELASLLGGRNSERVFFGDSSVGCSSDYEQAKRLANMMIERWAMGELGISKEMDFLREADAKATKILNDNRDFINAVASKLAEMGEISGEQIKKLYGAYKDGGMKSLESEIETMKAADKVTAKKIVKNLEKNLKAKGLL